MDSSVVAKLGAILGFTRCRREASLAVAVLGPIPAAYRPSTIVEVGAPDDGRADCRQR